MVIRTYDVTVPDTDAPEGAPITILTPRRVASKKRGLSGMNQMNPDYFSLLSPPKGARYKTIDVPLHDPADAPPDTERKVIAAAGASFPGEDLGVLRLTTPSGKCGILVRPNTRLRREEEPAPEYLHLIHHDLSHIDGD